MKYTFLIIYWLYDILLLVDPQQSRRRSGRFLGILLPVDHNPDMLQSAELLPDQKPNPTAEECQNYLPVPAPVGDKLSHNYNLAHIGKLVFGLVVYK